VPEFDFLASLPSIAPEIGLTVMAVVVLLLDSYMPASDTKVRKIALVSGLGMAVLAITPFIWAPGTTTTAAGEVIGSSEYFWGNMIRHDALASIFKVMILLAGAFTSFIAINDHGVGNKGEFHLVIIVATLGASLMAGSADLIMVFVALETLSIPLYILAGFNHEEKRSSESGLKYFLFGSFASAILLYGFSLLFGFAGTTNLEGIAVALANGASNGSVVPVLAAMLMVIVGFGFKISAVPFHFWTPDVYEGSPTPVTAFVSVASKAASIALLMRFLIAVFPASVVIDGQSIQYFVVTLVTIISIVTMTLGNVVALRQTNIKRMLAYSSIAQAGYALIGIAALQSTEPFGVSAVAFYMFMYTFTNLLIFAGVILFAEASGSEEISDMAGLQRRSPMLALAITIGLLSLAGIPPAAGFFGKLFLFQAAVEAGQVALAMIGVLNSIVALYYYLVVIKVMYVDHHEDEDKPIAIPRIYGWVLGITSVMVLFLGILPAPVIDWARDGAVAINYAVQTVIAAGL
jgi:NADH-quinone oxidoreductase subunit N